MRNTSYFIQRLLWDARETLVPICTWISLLNSILVQCCTCRPSCTYLILLFFQHLAIWVNNISAEEDTIIFLFNQAFSSFLLLQCLIKYEVTTLQYACNFTCRYNIDSINAMARVFSYIRSRTFYSYNTTEHKSVTNWPVANRWQWVVFPATLSIVFPISSREIQKYSKSCLRTLEQPLRNKFGLLLNWRATFKYLQECCSRRFLGLERCHEIMSRDCFAAVARHFWICLASVSDTVLSNNVSCFGLGLTIQICFAIVAREFRNMILRFSHWI